jgi:spermidine dehydrogenase
MAERSDRDLGMHRRIARRDFLDGVAFTALAAGAGGWPAGAEAADGSYPPALTGLRGEYDAAYAVAHRLRDRTFWTEPPPLKATGEHYDLVVVGGGISGLSAAYFYRQQFPSARVLVLDNHDDFGGHARRNEFRVGNRLLLSNAGTQSIESPAKYSPVAKRLLAELGVVPKRFYTYYDRRRYAALGTGVFFNKETFGSDRFVAGMGTRPWPEFLAGAPLSEVAKADIARIYTQQVDYLPHLTTPQKRALLAKTSYADFLTKVAGLSPDVLPFFQPRTNDLYGVGIDAVSALDTFEGGDDYGVPFPGFQGMALEGAAGKWQAPREEPVEEPYIFHFPDGNASISRLLVRKLVPGSVPGSTMEDVVTARADYSVLDLPGNAARIRLASTAVRARHVDPHDHTRGVEVAYVRSGALETVRANACVLACWNGVASYIAPELPSSQREALRYGTKVPLVYTHVAIRNWRPFAQLGVHQISAPGSYHPWTALDFPVDIGTYRSPHVPDDPMVLFMLRTPCRPGLPARDQQRAGRAELYATPFAVIERNVRDQLARMLGGAGFDPARDIAAITVNRWAHGYAYEYATLWDPDWPAGRSPAELGRKRFGRIAIANSDAAASAYTDAAIDQAHRAVAELAAVTP